MAVLVLGGFHCRYESAQVKEAMRPFTLKIWGVWDNKDDFQQIIKKYHALHPNITIVYRRLRPQNYEYDLLSAWAEGDGPDIFALPSVEIPQFFKKIAPEPTKIVLPYVFYQSSIPGCSKKTDKVVQFRPSKILTLAGLKDKYPDVVFYDVVYPFRDNQGHTRKRIFGLPLSLNTLGLFYNRDLLDRANIPDPPATWQDFIKDTQLLTKYDKDRHIIQAGAALGTYQNVQNSLGIISLLIMQNGGSLNGQGGNSFNRSLEALNFYLNFANPQSNVYTWNKQMPNSLQAFEEGKLAFYFGYPYEIKEIKAQAPNLNFEVAPVPQVDLSSPTNYANYWIYSVYSRSPHQKAAWDFLLFLSQKENAQTYLKQAQEPTALRSLIKTQAQENPELAPFVNQILTADGWHHYRDFNLIKEAWKNLFSHLVLGKKGNLNSLLYKTFNQINSLKFVPYAASY